MDAKRTGIKVLLGSITMFALVGGAESIQQRGPFDAVPAQFRQRLDDRLQEFVSHHRKKEWSDVYAMFSQRYMRTVDSGMSPDRFVEERRFSRILRFTPVESLALVDDKEAPFVIILGCGEYERTGLNSNVETNVEATWENGDWYFSELRHRAPCLDCEARRCKH
jgi:hypothetical protein